MKVQPFMDKLFSLLSYGNFFFQNYGKKQNIPGRFIKIFFFENKDVLFHGSQKIFRKMDTTHFTNAHFKHMELFSL